MTMDLFPAIRSNLTEYDTSNPGPLELGTIIGSTYKIESMIFLSPAAAVYRAWHLMLETDIAIKVLVACDLDKKALKRFQSEVKAACTLQHPNVVKLYAFGLLPDNSPYLVMEYVAGETLAEYLKKVKHLDAAKFVTIFSQVLSGLQCIHERRILHRDIKPQNILLSVTDGEMLAKLSDFGIAKDLDADSSQSLTATSELPGSPVYMSPEQCSKKVLDERSDLYSLGCVMYEALSGRPPFQSESSLELLYKHVNEKPVPLSSLVRAPASLCCLIEKCLLKEPDKRWVNATLMLAEFEKLDLKQSNYHGLMVLGLCLLLLFLITGFFLVSKLSSQTENTLAAKQKVESHKARTRHRLSAGQSLEQAQKLIQQGQLFIQKGEYTSAASDLLEAKRLLNEAGAKNYSEIYEANIKLAFMQMVLNDFADALKYVREGKNALKQNLQSAGCTASEQAQDEQYIDPLLKESICLINLRRFSDAEHVLKDLEIIQKHQVPGSKSRALKYDMLHHQSQVLLGKGELEKSKNLLRSLLVQLDREISIERDAHAFELKPELIIDLIRIAIHQNNRAEMLKNVEFLREQIALRPDVHPATAAHLYAVLSSSYMTLGLKQQALNAIDSSKLCADLIPTHNYHMAQTLMVMGLLAWKQDLNQSADESWAKAQIIQESLGDRRIVMTYICRAYLAYESGHDKEASQFVSRALQYPATNWYYFPPLSLPVEMEPLLAAKLKSEGNEEALRRLKFALTLNTISKQSVLNSRTDETARTNMKKGRN